MMTNPLRFGLWPYQGDKARVIRSVDADKFTVSYTPTHHNDEKAHTLTELEREWLRYQLNQLKPEEKSLFSYIILRKYPDVFTKTRIEETIKALERRLSKSDEPVQTDQNASLNQK